MPIRLDIPHVGHSYNTLRLPMGPGLPMIASSSSEATTCLHRISDYPIVTFPIRALLGNPVRHTRMKHVHT